jgi:acyl-CoA thioester hydrolase
MHVYSTLINETHLDFFGHVNNATYLVLFEQARWDLITQNGYGLEKVKETQLGPVILEIKLNFRKELLCRQEIMIETNLISYEGKIGKLMQKIIRGNDICTIAEVTFGLFDLCKRKLVSPTLEWKKAIKSHPSA